VERLFRGSYRLAEPEQSLAGLVAASRLVVPPDVLVTGVTALRLLGIGVGPVRPLHLVTTHPHPVRRPGLKVSRVTALPPAVDGVVLPEDAFERP
jgi:hypothetical protein